MLSPVIARYFTEHEFDTLDLKSIVKSAESEYQIEYEKIALCCFYYMR